MIIRYKNSIIRPSDTDFPGFMCYVEDEGIMHSTRSNGVYTDYDGNCFYGETIEECKEHIDTYWVD